MEIRELTEQDAEQYREVRLRSLKDHPESFGMAFEEEQNTHLDQFVQRLKSPNIVTFGAWSENQLVGIATLNRYAGLKTRHRAMLTGMYVAPEVRGQKTGRALIDAVVDQARITDGLEDVVLAVTVGNDAARQLYVKAGFNSYSIEPRYIKLGEQYFDIEWMVLRITTHG